MDITQIIDRTLNPNLSFMVLPFLSKWTELDQHRLNGPK